MLPEQFADLEPFAATWAIPDANDRYARRLASTMDELLAFYHAVVPRGEEVLSYLRQFDLDDMPDSVVNLMWLMGSLSAVSFAVDVFRQPTVPETCGASMPWTVFPSP